MAWRFVKKTQAKERKERIRAARLQPTEVERRGVSVKEKGAEIQR
jgi:hypothetical protein